MVDWTVIQQKLQLNKHGFNRAYKCIYNREPSTETRDKHITTLLNCYNQVAKMCNKVYLVHRRDKFRASQAMQDKAAKTPNIEFVMNSIPQEILGEKKGFVKRVTGLQLLNKETNELNTIEIRGVFVAIGVTPVTDLFKGQLDLDEQGYIITQGNRPLTNVPGVFAAGDVQDPLYRQAITAAASGCKAAVEAERFLMENE